MASKMPRGWEAQARGIVSTLSTGAFETLRERGWIGRCTPTDLARAVETYDRTLSPLPHEAFELADIYEVEGQRVWRVDLPLWTEEEGRSDLTLFLSVYEKNGAVVVEIDDLRVP